MGRQQSKSAGDCFKTNHVWRLTAVSLTVLLLTLMNVGTVSAADPTVSPSLTDIVVAGKSHVRVEFDHNDPNPGTYYYAVHWNKGGWSTVASSTVPSGSNRSIMVTAASVASNDVGSFGVNVCEPGDPNSCTGSDIGGPVAISVPYQLSVTPLAEAAKLDWKYYRAPGSNLIGFDVFVRANGQNWPASPTGSVDPDTRTFTFQGLTGGQTYELGVRAVQRTQDPSIRSVITNTSATPTGNDGGGANWDPHRARDDAGARFPFIAQPKESPGTIYVNNGGSITDAIELADENDVIVVGKGVYRETLLGNREPRRNVNKKITIRAADGAHPKVLGTRYVPTVDFQSYANAEPGVRRTRIWDKNPLHSLDSDSKLNESSGHYLALVQANDRVDDSILLPANLLPEQVYRVDSNTGDWIELGQVRWDGGINGWNHPEKGTPYYDNPPRNYFSYNPSDNNGKHFYVNLSLNDWANTSHFEIVERQEGIRLESGADGSSIAGLEFRGFSPRTDNESYGVITATGNTSDKNNIDRLNSLELRNVKVTDSSGLGIKLNYATNVTISRVTSNHNVGPGLNTNQVRGLDIEFSDFTDNAQHLNDRRSILAGVKISGESGTAARPITVRYSRFVSNGGNGLWCDLWCLDSIFVGNYFNSNVKNGLYYEVSENAVIASNLFINHGQSGIKISGSQNVNIVRNTFAGTAAHLQIASDIDLRNGNGDGERRPGGDTPIDTAGVDIEGNYFVEPNEIKTPIIASAPERALDGDGLANLPSERTMTYDRNVVAINNNNLPGPYRFEWDQLDDRRLTFDTPEEFTAYTGWGFNGATWFASGNPYDGFESAETGNYRLNTAISELTGIEQPIPSAAAAIMTGPTSGQAGAVFF